MFDSNRKPGRRRREERRFARIAAARTAARARHKKKLVSGVHGAITDSSALFTPDKGDTYKEFWSNVSTDWEDAVFSVVGTPFDENATPESLYLSGEPEAQIIVEKLRLGRQSKVLEIGVGVARLAVHIAPLVGSFTGADITKNMLAIAGDALKDRTNVRLVELPEVGPLPFPDASFDAVYAQAVFIHIDREDCWRYMREAARVLKPGGRAYFQFYNLLHPEGFPIFDWVSRYAVTPDGAVRGRVRFVTNVEVRHYATQAGLTIDERASHLLPVEQRYDFPLPMLNYDYYLIAVGEKPGTGAELLPFAERSRTLRFSDRYLKRYVDGFLAKVLRHTPAFHAELAGFLLTLDSAEAFATIHEIERATNRLRRAKKTDLELLPILRDAASDARLGDTPSRRVRTAIDRYLLPPR